jgi:hypothetical protein
MCQHFSIDRLVEYGTEALPDTTQVVNPAWRELDSQIRRQNGLLQREVAAFGALELPADLEPAAMAACEQQKGTLRQCIEARRSQIATLKTQRKALREAPAHQGPARSGPLLPTARRQKALRRHHQTHRLPG